MLARFSGHRRHVASSLDLCDVHVKGMMSVQIVLASFPPGSDALQTSKLYPCRNEIYLSIVSSWKRNVPRSLAEHRHLTLRAPLRWPCLPHCQRIQVSLRIQKGGIHHPRRIRRIATSARGGNTVLFQSILAGRWLTRVPVSSPRETVVA